MNKSISSKPSELVNEIAMSSKTNWLILEGETDIIFFRDKEVTNGMVKKFASGWENVLSTLQLVEKYKEKGKIPKNTLVLGIIDRDYREFLDAVIENENIIQTDYRDLEIMMFYSGAFKSVVARLCSNKIDADTDTDFESVKSSVCEISKKLSKFRFYSEKNNLKINFSDMKFSKFFNSKEYTLNEKELIEHLCGKNATKIEMRDWENAQKFSLPEKLNDDKFLLHGHDTMIFFGEGFKSKWGSNNSKAVAKEEIQKYFQVGYSEDEFKKTEMYKQIQKKRNASETIEK